MRGMSGHTALATTQISIWDPKDPLRAGFLRTNFPSRVTDLPKSHNPAQNSYRHRCGRRVPCSSQGAAARGPWHTRLAARHAARMTRPLMTRRGGVRGAGWRRTEMVRARVTVLLQGLGWWWWWGVGAGVVGVARAGARNVRGALVAVVSETVSI